MTLRRRTRATSIDKLRIWISTLNLMHFNQERPPSSQVLTISNPHSNFSTTTADTTNSSMAMASNSNMVAINNINSKTTTSTISPHGNRSSKEATAKLTVDSSLATAKALVASSQHRSRSSEHLSALRRGQQPMRHHSQRRRLHLQNLM